MNYAIVSESGLIGNRIILEVGALWGPPTGCILIEETQPMDIGGTYVNGVYTPPNAPEVKLPIPQSISDRQFFQQLAVEGIITQADALASNAAVIPPPLLKLIDAMPADQQFAAKMLIGGATVFERSNPLTIAIGTGYGMTSDQIDAFFTAAAVL